MFKLLWEIVFEHFPQKKSNIFDKYYNGVLSSFHQSLMTFCGLSFSKCYSFNFLLDFLLRTKKMSIQKILIFFYIFEMIFLNRIIKFNSFSRLHRHLLYFFSSISTSSASVFLYTCMALLHALAYIFISLFCNCFFPVLSILSIPTFIMSHKEYSVHFSR